MRHHVVIALGSNTHQSAHVQWASQRISHLLVNARFTRTLWTPDIHGTGQMYMNRIASGYTVLSLDDLEQELKGIEAETGRNHNRVTIDLDLMQYDTVRYHLKDWDRPYIQQLIPYIQ